jgi:hypothetical protein
VQELNDLSKGLPAIDAIEVEPVLVLELRFVSQRWS